MAEKLAITATSVGDLARPASLDAPLNDEGRFSFAGAKIMDSGEGYYIPLDQADKPLSPMETGTDIVLPIVAQLKGRPNRHHAYFYKEHYLAGSVADQAVRYSRLQRVSRKAHKAYHRQYHGTLMPRDEAAAVTAAILNSAGYIPKFSVKIEDDGTSIEEITPQERRALSKATVFSIERSTEYQGRMGKFLMDYALKQDLDHVRQSQIEEFLGLTPRKMAYNERLRARKLRLGLRLTNIAISVAIEPTEGRYREARGNEALRRSAPNTAWEWAKSLLKGREMDYLLTLEDRLLEKFGAPS